MESLAKAEMLSVELKGFEEFFVVCGKIYVLIGEKSSAVEF